MFFRILWGIDAIIALIVVYFFFIGLADGSISSFNITLWMGILIGLAVVLLGSIRLKNRDYPGMAKALLAIVALPAVLYGLLLLAMLGGGGRWN